MKYFKDENGQVYAFEADGSQDDLISENLVQMNDAEVNAHLSAVQSVPSAVTMRQARLALLQSGLLEQVNNAVLVGGEADKITWEYATEVSRSDALVKNLAVSLGLDESQLDDLFTLASTL